MPKPNGFALFIHEQKRSNPNLKDKTFDEVSRVVDPVWKAMSPEEKMEYQVKAKGPRTVNNNVKPGVLGGYDAIGRSLAEIEKQNQQRENEKTMKVVKARELVQKGLQREDFVMDNFYVMHVNIFVRTPDTNVVVPAEVSLAKFSLKDGLMDTYQAFINPGSIPSGYKYRCMERSQLKHKIPIYVETKDTGLVGTNSHELHRPDDKDIILDIIKFLGGTKTVFTMEEFEEDCQDVLETLCKRSGMNNIGLEMLRLPDLLFHLMQFPFASVAEAEFDKERFLYDKGLSCAWHESETDSQHCSQAYVMRWLYTLLAFTNDKFNVELVDDGRHAPKGSLNFEEDTGADWDNDIEQKIRPHDKNSIFASSDIRYRDMMEDTESILTTTDLMSSAAVSNVESVLEFEPSKEPSVTLASSQVSISSAETKKGNDTLLRNIRNHRTSSRMVAKF